jgi:hypothetical protein
MEPVIIAEVLDKSGKVHERIKLTHFPATLGRAYDNDLIINDDFVSPHHARIACSDSGEPLLTDLGTENGTYHLPAMQPVAALALGPETLLRLGQTLVRLRRPDFALTPTRIDKLAHSRFAGFFTSTAILALLTLLLLGLLGLDSYQSSVQAKTIGQLLLENIEIFVLVPVWAGVWALLSRIFMHHAAYVSHAVIATLGVIGFLCANVVVEYYAFGFSALLSADILFHVLLGLLASAMLYGHLRFTTLFSPRRIGVIAVSTAVALVGLSGFTAYVQGLEFSDTLPYPPELKPPQFQITRDKSLQDFMRDAEKIPQRLTVPH